MQNTIQLIKETDGVAEEITVRKIAERTQVGVGLINHYFGSKDKLIEMCVQHIINSVVSGFRTNAKEGSSPTEVTKTAAIYVADFLMANRQISKISILGDLKTPKEQDNTYGSSYGFAYCMSGGHMREAYMRKAFFLVSILQESFLRQDVLLSSLGVDYHDKVQRDAYVCEIVDMIMGGSV